MLKLSTCHLRIRSILHRAGGCSTHLSYNSGVGTHRHGRDAEGLLHLVPDQEAAAWPNEAVMPLGPSEPLRHPPRVQLQRLDDAELGLALVLRPEVVAPLAAVELFEMNAASKPEPASAASPQPRSRSQHSPRDGGRPFQSTRSNAPSGVAGAAGLASSSAQASEKAWAAALFGCVPPATSCAKSARTRRSKTSFCGAGDHAIVKWSPPWSTYTAAPGDLNASANGIPLSSSSLDRRPTG